VVWYRPSGLGSVVGRAGLLEMLREQSNVTILEYYKRRPSDSEGKGVVAGLKFGCLSKRHHQKKLIRFQRPTRVDFPTFPDQVLSASNDLVQYEAEDQEGP
jgi:hypothetical protein